MKFGNFEIRLIGLNDAPGFFKLVSENRDRIATYLPTTARLNASLETTTAFILQKIASAEAREQYCFVLSDERTRTMAGALFLKNFDWTVPKCELGYFIARSYEGQGITSTALSKLITHCFNELHLNKLFLRAGTDNMASCRVAEKNGFIREGLLRHDFKTPDGKLVDIFYYGLLKNPDPTQVRTLFLSFCPSLFCVGIHFMVFSIKFLFFALPFGLSPGMIVRNAYLPKETLPWFHQTTSSS